MYIISDTVVQIGNQSRLQDVIIYAPKIEFDSAFEGTLQAIATDSLLVGAKCILSYPTVLGLIKLTSSVDNPLINIQKESEITGVVFQYQDYSNSRYNVKLIVGEGVIVHGQVYSDGLVQVNGSVHGNVTCESFTLSTPSSVYGNHLLNATIDFNSLSENFTGISLVNASEVKNVVKWVY
jgi:hypothetical protein